MAVSIINYLEKDVLSWAVLKDDKAIKLGQFTSLKEFLNNVSLASIKSNLAKKADLNLDELKLQSPVTEPCRVICQGTNYLEHIKETGCKIEQQPYNLLFAKDSSSLAPAQGNLARPKGVELLDYELELGLVMKTSIKNAVNIDKSNLSKYVAGIVIGNDISARDIQIPQEQWFKGKSYRGFCPVGPYLCLLEEEDFAKLDNLQLELKVNGQTRQKVNTSQMIFKPSETLTEISKIFNLTTGDLILTGTPGGVALQVPSVAKIKMANLLFTPLKRNKLFIKGQKKITNYLKSGDIIQATITDEDDLFNLGEQKLTCK